MHWMNTMVNYCGPFEYEVGYCERLKSFLETNLEWMQQQMELHPDCPYWHQVDPPALPASATSPSPPASPALCLAPVKKNWKHSCS